MQGKDSQPRVARVLFLCTGNYYRSRFAEILFNSLAQEAGLDWVAGSCGLAVDWSNNNVGAISSYTVAALADRGIAVIDGERFPVQAQAQHLEEADLIVAVKEAEHRPLLAERFPGWEDRIEYWYVHDLGHGSWRLSPRPVDRARPRRGLVAVGTRVGDAERPRSC